jgi:hypothetical protein
MGSFVWFSLTLWAACAQIEIIPTEQAAFTAKLLAIDANAVEFEVENRPSKLALDKVRRLSFATRGAGSPPVSAKPLAENTGGTAKLSDGSQLNYQQFALRDGKAVFQLAADSRLQVSGKELLYVQLQKLTPAQWTQWQAIVQSRASADLLALIRSPEAIEKLEGIVLAVDAEQVTFDFGGESINAPQGKLAGLRFFSGSAEGSSANAPPSKLVAIAQDRSGNRWMCSHISLPSGGQQISLSLQCGASLVLPLDQLAEIDFSTGSTVYLANLTAIERETADSLTLAVPVSGSKELFGAYPRDLREPGSASLGPSLEFLGTGSISFRIPADYTRLRGEVELRPSGNRFTPCVARIKLNNQLLWEQNLPETGRRWPVDVAVAADARLKLEVASSAATPIGDVVLWHDIRLVK